MKKAAARALRRRRARLRSARVRGRRSELRPGTSLWASSGKPPAGTPKGASLNQFFPGRLTVNAGDKVTFSSVGFHTVTYARRKPYPPFLGPAPGQVYEDIADSAGQPFFFDGEQKFGYNPAAIGPVRPEGDLAWQAGELGGRCPHRARRSRRRRRTRFPKTGVVQAALHRPSSGHGDDGRRQAEGRGRADDRRGGGAGEGADRRSLGEGEGARREEAAEEHRSTWVSTARKAVGWPDDVLDFVPDLTTVKVGTTVNFVVKAPTRGAQRRASGRRSTSTSS